MALEKSTLDGLIRNLEDRLEAAKKMRSITTEHPSLLAELATMIESPNVKPKSDNQDSPAVSLSRSRKGTVADQVHQHFIDAGNPWLAVSTLFKTLRVSRGVMAHVIYTAHPEWFESRKVAGSVKLKEWRLRPSELVSQSNAAGQGE